MRRIRAKLKYGASIGSHVPSETESLKAVPGGDTSVSRRSPRRNPKSLLIFRDGYVLLRVGFELLTIPFSLPPK
jgi:hypothetical protein